MELVISKEPDVQAFRFRDGLSPEFLDQFNNNYGITSIEACIDECKQRGATHWLIMQHTITCH